VSDSPAEKRRARRAPILGATLHGVGGLLQEVLAPMQDLQVVQTPDASTLEAALRNKQLKYRLPLVGYGVQSTSEGASAFNQQALRTGGAIMSYDKDAGEYTVLKASSVELSVQVTLLTDSYEALWSFIELWHSREYWGFDVRLRGMPEGAGVGIGVTADKSLSVPTRAAESGGDELYRMQGTLAVKTYSGFLWEVPDVRALEALEHILRTDVTGRAALEAFAKTGATSGWSQDIVTSFPRSP